MKLYNKFIRSVGLAAAVFIIIILFLSKSMLLGDFSKT
ncbi:MAG: hypothetical protein ACJAX4_001170 [Clostridium sp.]|jgi:hypothetical protein